MSAAPLGDDVWGDDPTVAALYRVVTCLTGKEAALPFPTGTKSNLAAVLAHCGRSDEVILRRRAHICAHDTGGESVLGGVSFAPIENASDGTLSIAAMRGAVRADDIHLPRTAPICLENTFAGEILLTSVVGETAALTSELDLPLHLDGARVWNAAVASGDPIGRICAPFESASLRFSKGLGMLVGSVLVGSREPIRRALRPRKMLGRGMRQSGMFAAACLYALSHHVDRLAQDHQRGAGLADGLAGIGQFGPVWQATNIVSVAVPAERCALLQTHLAKAEVIPTVQPLTRLVTNLGVDDAGIERVLRAFANFDARIAA